MHRKLKGESKHASAWRRVRPSDTYVPDAEPQVQLRPPDPLDILRNTKVVTPPTEAVEALAASDRALREASRQVAEPSPIWPVVCQEHQWRVEPVMPGAPQLHRSRCPDCLAEQSAPKPTGPDYYVDGGGPTKAPTTQQDVLYEEWKTRKRASGWIEPGSEEERQAIEQSDDGRVEVLADEAARKAGHPGMRLAYSRSYDNVQVWVPKKKKRPGRNRQLNLWSGEFNDRIVIDADANA